MAEKDYKAIKMNVTKFAGDLFEKGKTYGVPMDLDARKAKKLVDLGFALPVSVPSSKGTKSKPAEYQPIEDKPGTK